MKLTEEIEEFINLTITEHMGKEYRRIFLSSGTERWIKITKSNKKYIEIFFISEE